ncbi:CoA transferase [Rhodococcus sp. T2V]|uniref:CaiB/BaiF CoA transferase family protein n=1 Tax=Rhodococcus sp. T2V TaxID=3034164 RepID=UPI0023E0CB9A|nr:CoA transferase [Rhodococcus sp. T2V]MDF3312136.1 CoA transferase [Rhodococcus sp. T2V]
MVVQVDARSGQVDRLPLSDLRIIDHTDGNGTESIARILADLGADVIRIEPPEGGRSRGLESTDSGVSLYDVVHNANKRSVLLDLSSSDGVVDYLRLVASADLLVTSRLDQPVELTPDALAARFPTLVILSITDFGRTGPYRDWVATEATHLALGGVLSRSGLSDAAPILPPGQLATESAAAQAAWAALSAYYHRLLSGHGDVVDFSVHEGIVGGFDPGFGIGGTAGGGVPGFEGPRGRPDARHLYPVFACADGWVRICVLSARQWQGMFRWLGEPENLSDPRFASLAVRFAETAKIQPVIARLLAPLTRAEVMAAGDAYGVPTAGLATPEEVLRNEHFSARGLFTSVELTDGTVARIPNGMVEVDGTRAGVRTPAPTPGQDTDEVFAGLAAGLPSPETGLTAPQRELPLDGLRVLDLGVIVVGAETGRLFADLGADVIKIENRAFPDGSRQSIDGSEVSASFAYGHRSKRSLGLNLRDERGKALFVELVRRSDVVLSNFKPGTMESLGLGERRLREANPGIVLAESSAFGPSGPWSRKMGYGPLVRSAVGLSGLWRYSGNDAESLRSYSDTSTVYPDHVAARIGAIAVLAKLVDRRQTGVGGTVAVAQAEVIVAQLGAQLARESIEPGALSAGRTRVGVVDGVLPCAGDDEWCVISVRNTDDWTGLASVVGLDVDDPRFCDPTARSNNSDELLALVADWTRERSPREATESLQAVGIPGGMMQRIADMFDDPQLVERRFLRPMAHPMIDQELPGEGGPSTFRYIADPESRPAPVQGEHTVEVLVEVLGLSWEEVEALVADGIAEVSPAPVAGTRA